MAGSSHYDPNIHHRRSIRLPGYDYSQAGMYFVTICTHNRINLFGEIGGVGNEWTSVGAGSKPALTEPALTVQMRLNEYGEIVQNTWNDLVHHISGIELGEFVVMPNHIHGIIIIVGAGSVGADSVRAGSKPAPHPTITQQPLSEIIRQFKTFSARRINEKRKNSLSTLILIRQTPTKPTGRSHSIFHLNGEQAASFLEATRTGR